MSQFREDDSRVRKDHAPENMSVLLHIAPNLLKQETTSFGMGVQHGPLYATTLKRGIKIK